MLTPEELSRYDRQIIMEGFGEGGQEKLKRAKVFIAGAGGLGSPVALYLAAAGIGTIRLVDHDTVDLPNLNRQVLHWTEDIGKSKVESASWKLKRLNEGVQVEAVCRELTPENILGLTLGCDVIVDATDNLPTRYLLNKAALSHNIPFIHGAVHGLSGRVMTIVPGKTACLMCVYRGAVVQGKFPVIGTTPAIIGSIQAGEVIKYLTGIGELLTDKLLVFDGSTMTFSCLSVSKNPNCEHCREPSE